MSSNHKSTNGNKNVLIEMLKSDALGGILLIGFTLIALIWANSPFKESYHHLLDLPLGFEFGHFKLEMHLIHWINDGLMAIFFYLVGLEIKREITAGELSSLKKAALPAMGALGGMIMPAVIYVIFIIGSGRTDAINGWGVPMATDIAFSLGIISLLGKRVPLALKVFLVALAIVDDLGAILVIAVFYTSQLHLGYLMIGLGILVFLAILNRLNFRIISFYHLAGFVVWYCFLQSGIHATIAGVLLAFTIPIKRELNFDLFRQNVKEMKLKDDGHTDNTLADHQIEEIHELRAQIKKIQSPVQRLEHDLHASVNYLIMPVFALANAGVTLTGNGGETFSVVTLAIIVALFVGKPLGITVFSWLGCKMGITELPLGVQWKQLFGVAILGGLGFTMSLFIANLASFDEVLLGHAKIGILIGSLIAGFVGYYALNMLFPNKNKKS
jgi:NhaA family Na+:H+ antiporter